MASCAVCREDIKQGERCSRCGYDNSQAQEVNSLVGYFCNFWGALSLLLVLVSAYLLLLSLSTWQDTASPSTIDEILQPVVSIRVSAPIAFLVTLIIASYMYSLCDRLHHYTRTRRFRADPGRSIALWALIFFVIAVLLIFFLGFSLATKDSIVAPQGYSSQEVAGLLVYGSAAHLFFKLMMTGCLVFTFVFLSLAASMMAAYLYGKYVDERRPQPLYLNEPQLLKVVLNDVRTHLDANGGSGDGSDLELSISQMKRLEDGGMSLVVHYEGGLTTKGEIVVREDKTWDVEADYWGRLKNVDEKKSRLVKVDGATPASIGEEKEQEEVVQPVNAVLDQVRELLGSNASVRVRRFERTQDGGVTLTLRP